MYLQLLCALVRKQSESWIHSKKQIITIKNLVKQGESSLNSKIIFIPFIIGAIAMVGKNIALLCGKKNLAAIFNKLFTIGFLLFWFGFLSVSAYICIRDKNYNMLAFTLPFWLAGIFVVKRRFFRNQSEKNGRIQIPIGIIVGCILVLVTLIAGIMILIQGVMNVDWKLIFTGGFFTFGAFTFVLAALTVKGCFERYRVDVLGLYIGILFVVIGIGVIVMIYNQRFGLWIVIPVLMIGVGVIQIIRCMKNKKNE